MRIKVKASFDKRSTRARRTAQTELLTMYNHAQQEAREQNPSADKKTWRHRGANKPRSWHIKMNGQTVGKREKFTITGGPDGTVEAMYPCDPSLPASERINCHCSTEDVIDDDIFGMTAEERQKLQDEARRQCDAEWEAEINAKNKAKAGIEVEEPEEGDLSYNQWKEQTNTEKPTKYSSDKKQFKNYSKRLGESAPKTFDEFVKLKYGEDTQKWDDLQVNYRYTGIRDRLAEKYSNLTMIETPADIPKEYSDAVNRLSKDEKDGLLHYSHYDEGVKMNRYLGGVEGVELTNSEKKNLENTMRGLSKCDLPYDTILYRGTESKLLNGYDKLSKNKKEWKGKTLETSGNTSTSIVKSASYVDNPGKDVEMIIMAPGGQKGAGYINDISYNLMHEGEAENGYKLKQEYEVLLHPNSSYSIIEAQSFKGKTILVVRWDGYAQ